MKETCCTKLKRQKIQKLLKWLLCYPFEVHCLKIYQDLKEKLHLTDQKNYSSTHCLLWWRFLATLPGIGLVLPKNTGLFGL